MLAGAAVVLAASGLLLVARRPAPPIRIIQAPDLTELLVQVDGAVARPGVYRLPSGARVDDALTAAGGMGPDADTGAVNRARPVRDGERVTVPQRAPAVRTDTGPAAGGVRDGSPQDPPTPLDLNAATASDLEALPGVGPVLARRIVEHRTSRGGFQRLDDLLQVKGVGPRLLDRLRTRVVIR